MKIFIGFLLFLLIGCSQNPLKGFGQSDIDIITEIHAKNAPERVRELEHWGAVFDRTKDGLINQRNFGGHMPCTGYLGSWGGT